MYTFIFINNKISSCRSVASGTGVRPNIFQTVSYRPAARKFSCNPIKGHRRKHIVFLLTTKFCKILYISLRGVAIVIKIFKTTDLLTPPPPGGLATYIVVRSIILLFLTSYYIHFMHYTNEICYF